MGLIKLDENQLYSVETGSNETDQEAVYEQGNFTALFQQTNTAGSLFFRGQQRAKPVDLKPVQDLEFTPENVNSFVQKEYGNAIYERVSGYDYDNWEDVIRRANYVKANNVQLQQVASNYTTAERILYGLPLALIDIDAPLIATGVGAVNKAAKLLAPVGGMTKTGKVATAATGGAVAGATAMTTYEASQGIYNENSVLHAMGIGLALGGGLSLVFGRGKDTVVENVDASTGKVLSKEEAAVKKLSEAKELEKNINEVITEQKAREKAVSQDKKDIDRAEKNDRGVVRFDRRSKKARLTEEKQAAQGFFEKAKEVYTTADEKLKNIVSQITELTGGMTKAKKDAADIEKLSATKQDLIKQTSPVKGQITKLGNQLKAIAKKRDAASNAKRVELKKKLKDQQKKLTDLEAKIQRQDTELSKFKEDPKTTLELGTVNLAKLTKEEKAAQEAVDKALAAKTAARKKWSEKVEEESSFVTRVRKDEVPDSVNTTLLKDKAEMRRLAASGEGLKELLRQRDLLTSDLEKMAADDFNLSTLYGIRNQNKTVIQKLEEELASIVNTKDITKAPEFKTVPEWMRKGIISPIERILNFEKGTLEENQIVQGLGAMLHGGTLHHGLTNTYNAWNIKKELDDLGQWMRADVTALYHEAKKDGYKGTVDDFEELVSNGVYYTTGNLRRDMNKGIAGTVSAEERMGIWLKREGATERKYMSEDKNVNKAVDKVIDYYEAIWKRGNSLGIDAFQGLMKGYAKRNYSATKFAELGEENVVSMLVDAQKNYASITQTKQNTALLKEWEDNARGIYKAVIDGEYRKQEVTTSIGMPKQTSTGALKSRTLEAYDDDLIPLLDTNFRSATSLYGLQIHGRLAIMEKLGVYKDADIAKLLDDNIPTGHPQLRNDFNAVIETILGTREIAKDMFDPLSRATKFVSSLTTLRHIMGFALPTITESANIAAINGYKSVLEGFGISKNEIARLYAYGSPSDRNGIMGLISYGDARFSTKANRMEVETTFDSTGRGQGMLDTANRIGSVFGGLMPITDMLRMTTATASVDFLAKMSVSKNISKTDKMRLGDMGFKVEDLAQVRETLKVGDDGVIGNYDRATWGALDRKISFGVQTMVERTILHPNGATLPRIMTNMDGAGFIPRIFGKFLRFPIESGERLLGRGLQEMDAKQLMALGGNVAMWSLILMAKDAVKDEDKQRYNGEDGMKQLFLESMAMNSYTAAPLALADNLVGATTGNTVLGYQYTAGGAPAGIINDIQRKQFNVNLYGARIDVVEGATEFINNVAGLNELTKED